MNSEQLNAELAQYGWAAKINKRLKRYHYNWHRLSRTVTLQELWDKLPMDRRGEYAERIMAKVREWEGIAAPAETEVSQ